MWGELREAIPVFKGEKTMKDKFMFRGGVLVLGGLVITSLPAKE